MSMTRFAECTAGTDGEVHTPFVGKPAPVSSLLAALICEVPEVWTYLTGNCLKKLMGTNQELRTGAQQHVTYLQLAKGWYLLDTQLIAAKSWEHLEALDLRLGHISIEAAAELSKVHCPRLAQLLISGHHDALPSARTNIFQKWSRNWPLLHTFHCDFKDLRSAEVMALVQIRWPLLQSLHLRPNDFATEQLMQGNWPLLRHLSLQGVDQGTKHLSKCVWQRVESLQLEQCSFFGAQVLTQDLFPCLQKLALFDVDLWWDLDWYEQLTKKWPCLTELHIKMRQPLRFWGEMEQCSFKKLHRLKIQARYINDDHVAWIFDLQLPSLLHISLCGHFSRPVSIITHCMAKWPALRSIELGLDCKGVLELNSESLITLKSTWPRLDVLSMPCSCS